MNARNTFFKLIIISCCLAHTFDRLWQRRKWQTSLAVAHSGSLWQVASAVSMQSGSVLEGYFRILTCKYQMSASFVYSEQLKSRFYFYF